MLAIFENYYKIILNVRLKRKSYKALPCCVSHSIADHMCDVKELSKLIFERERETERCAVFSAFLAKKKSMHLSKKVMLMQFFLLFAFIYWIRQV
jgi:hypothetical protein